MYVLDFVAYALELVMAGLVLAVLIGVGAGLDAEFSCAPADDDEDVPEDPDRERDYRIADEMGAW